MYKILTVIDNRIMLRDIYNYLKSEKEYEIHFVLFSPMAFSEFLDFKPDIVLLDAEAFVYYKRVIDLFSKSMWNYHVLLIVSNDDLDDDLPNVTLINKKELNRSLLLKSIKQTLDYMQVLRLSSEKTDQNDKLEISALSCNYSLIFAKYTKSYQTMYSQEDVSSLKSCLESYGVTDTIITNQNDILCHLNKKNISNHLTEYKIANLIFEYLGYQYTVFFMNNISWWDTEKAYAKIMNYAPYAYFLNQQVVNVDEAKVIHHPITFNEIDHYLASIATVLLNNSPPKLKSLLQELCLHKLKESHDLSALDYFRWMLSLYAEIFNMVCSNGPVYKNLTYSTIEQEYIYLENYFMQMMNCLYKISFPLIMKQALTVVFMHYQENISLDDTAKALNINKNYLSRMFHQYLDSTVLGLIQHMKLHKAYFLTTKTKRKIIEISTAIGYNDAHYFSRLFKKQTGLSPEEFRCVGNSIIQT